MFDPKFLYIEVLYIRVALYKKLGVSNYIPADCS